MQRKERRSVQVDITCLICRERYEGMLRDLTARSNTPLTRELTLNPCGISDDVIMTSLSEDVSQFIVEEVVALRIDNRAWHKELRQQGQYAYGQRAREADTHKDYAVRRKLAEPTTRYLPGRFPPGPPNMIYCEDSDSSRIKFFLPAMPGRDSIDSIPLAMVPASFVQLESEQA